MAKTNSPPDAANKLTRSQVAALLNLGIRDVAKYDGKQLKPTRSADRKWLYDCSEVRALVLANARDDAPRETAPHVDGQTTAEVFELFEKRTPLARVAIVTKKPMRLIQHLHAEYDEAQRSMTLPPKVIKDLTQLLAQQFLSPRGLVKATDLALEARFQEGRADTSDYGAIVDPETGKWRAIDPVSGPTATSLRGARERSKGAAPVSATAPSAMQHEPAAAASLATVHSVDEGGRIAVPAEAPSDDGSPKAEG